MTGLIILAAGSSSRLGQPKQNLIYRKKTLLQYAIETGLASACTPVVVVLGAKAALIKPTIEKEPVIIVDNDNWQEGIASSIKSGINEIQKIEPQITDVILMLCDQPFVDTHLLNHLILAKSKTGIVACAYNNIIGTPALFDKIYFPELLDLQGHEGAKKLLIKYHDDVIDIYFPKGSIDVDTIEDLEKLQLKSSIV